MPKGKGKVILERVIAPRKGYFYYFDKKGNVLETARNTSGGKPGRTVNRKNKCSKGKR